VGALPWAEGLRKAAVALQEQVRTALARSAVPSADRGGAGAGAGAGGGGGAGGGDGAGGYGEGSAVVEAEVSGAMPDVVRAVETAVGVRSTAPGARRARIRVSEGAFAWRGVLPLSALQERTPDGLCPAEVLLHVASALPISGSRGAAYGGGHAGGGGGAALHGAWLLPEHSLGCFENVSLATSGVPASTVPDPLPLLNR